MEVVVYKVTTFGGLGSDRRSRWILLSGFGESHLFDENFLKNRILL